MLSSLFVLSYCVVSNILTGPDPTPIEIYKGRVTPRDDIRTTHDEADVISVQQMVHLASIRATAQKHAGFITQALPAHVLSGCDTVAYLWGIGKGTVGKIPKNCYQLRTMGDLNAAITDVMCCYMQLVMGHRKGQTCQLFVLMYGHQRWQRKFVLQPLN